MTPRGDRQSIDCNLPARRDYKLTRIASIEDYVVWDNSFRFSRGLFAGGAKKQIKFPCANIMPLLRR
jgi:hypothetical protein